MSPTFGNLFIGLVFRLGVCRVVRRPLRSSRGLRLRRLLGSRILRATW